MGMPSAGTLGLGLRLGHRQGLLLHPLLDDLGVGDLVGLEDRHVVHSPDLLQGVDLGDACAT